MTDWDIEPEPEFQRPALRNTGITERMSGASRFDPAQERIAEFQERVASALIAPYSLDEERNLIVLRKGRQAAHDICAPLLITYLIRSSSGVSASLRVEMLSDDGQIEICDIPNDDLGSAAPQAVALLRARGIYMPGNAREVAALLRSFRPEVLRSADLPFGWHPSGKPIFGLRDGCAVAPISGFPAEDKPLPFPLFEPDLEKLHRWKSEIASLATGNPYVLFGISLALTGPILRLLKRSAIGFNLAMPTSSGKTTIVKIMENMWPSLPIEGWHQSDAGLQDNCIASSDSLLLLDEMPKARDRAVIDSVYFIMNGRPRGVRREINKASNVTRENDWSMAVFSTAEDPFEEIVKRVRGTSDGALVRMIDLKPVTIWQDLHAHPSQYDLIKQITSSLPKTSGIAGPVFVKMLIKQYGRIVGTAPSLFEATLRELEETLGIKRAEASGVEMRVLEAFAAVATAGQLAVKFGVLPQSVTDVRHQVFTVASHWLNPTSAVPNLHGQHQDAVERLRSWLAKNASSKLIPLDACRTAPMSNRIAEGWRTEETYFILKTTMQHATELKHGLKDFVEHMAGRNILLPGGQPNSFQQRMGAGVHGRPWVYALDRAALEADAEAE